MPSRTSGAEGGPGKRIGSNPDTAPRSDPYVFGARPSAVATLVDRATRYTMVVALPDGYKAETVAAAVIEQMGTLPTHVCRSLTWDRGREMASPAIITAALSMPVFFCDPHHPWQRGTNENTVSVVVGPGGPVRQAGAGSTE